jgi:agmatine/peptidylarginine deiminase
MRIISSCDMDGCVDDDQDDHSMTAELSAFIAKSSLVLSKTKSNCDTSAAAAQVKEEFISSDIADQSSGFQIESMITSGSVLDDRACLRYYRMEYIEGTGEGVIVKHAKFIS